MSEQEALDHNTALARIVETGDEEEVSMILGHKDRLRCGGIIRTGIKVLKQGATPQEVALFKELEAQGLPYDEIDIKLGGKPRSKTSKLYPKNADHFVVRCCDFVRASDAELIMNRYADPDGKLRTLPIWLSVGELDKALHHGFKAFNGAGNVVAASFYEGKDLKVRYLPKDHTGPSKRDDWKVAALDPDNPVSPAGHKLQFGGVFRFNVPGMRGFDEIIIATKSWYGMSYSVALLRRVRSVLGRFNGLLNGEAFLQISKVPEEMTDPSGKRVTQYIPVLDLSIDPMELARHAEMAPSRGFAAIGMFNGQRPSPAPARPEPPPAPEPAPSEEPAPFGEEDPAIIRAKEEIHKIIKWAHVPPESFRAWVQEQFQQDYDGMAIDLLRTLYKTIKEECKTKDSATVFADACRNAQMDAADRADDLPFGKG